MITPELSVVIISWNSEKYVKNCLDSVLQCTKNYATEIVLIDNASSDQTVSLLSSYPAELLIQDKNLGVAKARNIGIKKATGKYIWLLDIDTIVNETALSEMFRFMENNENCGICGCKLTDSSGNVQDSCRKFPTLRFKVKNILDTLLSKYSVFNFIRQKLVLSNKSQFYKDQMNSEKSFDVDYLIGACQLIRKKAIDEVGLLDEHIFYGPEDADYCFRMKKKAWKITYLPFTSIIHEYQQITKKKIFSRMSFIHTKALFYYFWKHKQF